MNAAVEDEDLGELLAATRVIVCRFSDGKPRQVQAALIVGTDGLLYAHPMLGPRTARARPGFVVTHMPTGKCIALGLRDPTVAAHCGRELYAELVAAGVTVSRKDLATDDLEPDLVERLNAIRRRYLEGAT